MNEYLGLGQVKQGDIFSFFAISFMKIPKPIFFKIRGGASPPLIGTPAARNEPKFPQFILQFRKLREIVRCTPNIKKEVQEKLTRKRTFLDNTNKLYS